ncbi:MAG: CDC27 family protein [Saprospiraceae bacterium]
MPSLLSGFEYDIFISYRHKDNKGDHWVTEFVNALKAELEGTFKEDISIYFDFNPHDGLLETHNVDKSLEGKLKCLIFIPIISQTYCDPKSFAWQHEFCAFNRMAKEDQFGRDIRLSNGNVASRILPVKIHDLDAEDKATLEHELGGVLRAIEFIYKEPGVNRPLKPGDNKVDNQNKTDYRNQVNKIANAIKEVITALKYPTVRMAAASEELKSFRSDHPNASSRKNKAIIFSFLILLLAVISFLLYKRYSSPTFDAQPKTIAVIPFVNLSADQGDEYFAEGVCNEILTQLSRISSLHVISRTSMLQFKDSKKTMKEIGETIGADVLLEGSVQKSGNKVHISVQLVNAKNDTQLWAETYDKEFKDIFSIQSDVATSIATQLRTNLTSSEKARIAKKPTTNMEAYNLYLKGSFEIQKVSPEGLELGLDMMNRAIKLDPDFALPYIGIAYYYGLATDFFMAPNVAMPQLKIAAQTALSKDSTLADAYAWYSNYELWYAWNWEQGKNLSIKAIELEPNKYLAHFFLSWYYSAQGNLEEAIKESTRMVELEPMNPEEGSFHALMYYYARQYDEALKQLDKLSSFDPNYPFAHFVRGQCYIQQRKFEEAIDEQKKAHEIFAAPWSHARLAYAYACAGKKQQAIAILDSLKRQSASQYVASDVVASVYVALGDKDHAFEYLGKALSERAGWMLWIKVDPIWDPIRKDVRFSAVVKQMGL